MFTLNVCVCVQLQQWVLWQQMMVQLTAKIKRTKNANVDVKCEQGLRITVLFDNAICRRLSDWLDIMQYIVHIKKTFT